MAIPGIPQWPQLVNELNSYPGLGPQLAADVQAAGPPWASGGSPTEATETPEYVTWRTNAAAIIAGIHSLSAQLDGKAAHQRESFDSLPDQLKAAQKRLEAARTKALSEQSFRVPPISLIDKYLSVSLPSEPTRYTTSGAKYAALRDAVDVAHEWLRLQGRS